MSDTINGYWFSEINTSNLSVVDEGILRDISKMYSENYGSWINGGKITTTLRAFLSIHNKDLIYCASNKSGEIVGFLSVSKRNNIILITSECIKKEYRDKGLFKNLISYMIEKFHNLGDYYIGVVTANPIILWTLETYPNMSYIDLEEEVSNNVDLGINVSILIDETRRKSYKVLKKSYKRSENLCFKKINI